MLALIHDYPLGSAEYLEFVNANTSEPLPTQADARFELTEVCLEQKTGGGRPDGHAGVEVDFIVQRFDVRGTNTFVANATLDMFTQDKGATRCAFLHPLAYKLEVGGWRNVSMLQQNAIPWAMTLHSEFDAEINMLAFPADDNVTDRRERAALTMQHGQFLTSLTEAGSYDTSGKNGLSDARFQTTRRSVTGYALTTAYKPRGGGVSKTGELCDSACVEAGGAYQSWQPHLVVQWNLTSSTGNPDSSWADVENSTWGKPLKVRDERRYFAVTYDRTVPTVEVMADSVKFTYAYNVTKCGSQQYVNRPTARDENGLIIKEPLDFPERTKTDGSGEEVPVPCLPTSTTDTLELNFTANEPGTYYLYAHPSFDQAGLEKNFSGLVGRKWPYSVTDTGLYTKHVMCDTNSSTSPEISSSCDSFGGFPRSQRLKVPMDAEAFIFGYDFTFSEFAVYVYAEDDGYASEFSGSSLTNAPGYEEFKAVYGNYSGYAQNLVDPSLILELEWTGLFDTDPDSDGDALVRYPLSRTERANRFNESEWSSSRFIINSAKDSNLSQAIRLVPDADHGFTTEFGTVAKVHLTTNPYADEFDYTSHRSKFYRFNYVDEDPDVGTDNLHRNNVNSYYTNTDAFIAYENSIGRGQNQMGDNALFPQVRLGYNLTRNKYLETVFMPDTSDRAEAVASSSPAGNGVAPVIMGLNMTWGVNDDFFYMVGQRDTKADGDQFVYAQLRLLYSNDPLFQFVPLNTVAQVGIWNYDIDSVLPDASTVMDDTGYSPPRSLPVLNVTAKNNIDYTTDAGGLCTLLLSLTEQPTGIVKFNVNVPDKFQAQLYQGKSPALLFSPTNFENLEVTLEGLNDHDNTNGDVSFDVEIALGDTQDPRFLYRHDEFNFAVSLTNLATKDDVRLAVGFNRTLCRTTERGGWCDVPLQVCAHNAANNGVEVAAGCDALVTESLSQSNPFSSLPIFQGGVDKVVVTLNVSNPFESKIVAVSSNGRFDASSSSVDCEDGARGGHGSLEGGCSATVVFAPFSDDGDASSSSRPWQGDGQGPYIAYVRLQGVDDFEVDGLANNVLSVASAFVVRGREKAEDVVLYRESLAVKNVDDDTTTVRLGDARGGALAPSRFLEVTPSSCSTSEDADVGECPVTVSASFELLNTSVTTEFDTVECAKVSLDLTWYFDNATTSAREAVEALTKQFSHPELRAGPLLDHYGQPPRVRVADTYSTDGSTPYNLNGWSAVDIPSAFWQSGQELDVAGASPAYRAREDYCLAPGNNTGTFLNASTLFVPYSGGSAGGGWVASIFVTGTDNVLWSSLGYPNHPSGDQLGNFTYEVPVAGIPIVLQGQMPDSMEVQVVVGSSSTGGLILSNLTSSNTDFATSMTGALDTTMRWTCTSSCSVSFNLNSDDDDVDDDDEEYTVTATVQNVTLRTPVDGESIITLSSLSQYTVLPMTHYDDDTAGLLLEALDSPPLRSYRTDLLLPSDSTRANPDGGSGGDDDDSWVGGRRFFGMKYNTTSEGTRLNTQGDPEHSNQTWFNVSLTSQPRHNVVVTVTANPVHNEWGWQFEGVPTEGYVVKSYESPSMWVTGTNDSVVDPWNSGLDLTFTPSNWAEPQTVSVTGLDDFLDDGDRDYTLTLTAASSDLYYDSGSSSNASWSNLTKLQQEQYPRTGAYMPLVTVPLRNLDDDTAGFVALQNGTRCSEPYYGLDAAVQLYLSSKPVDMVSVWLSSSDPLEAGPTQSLVGITRDNWEFMKEVPVKSVDDFVADGNVNFTVTLDLFYTSDAQYSDTALYEGSTFQFVSMDDPNDGLGMGASVEVSVSSDDDYTTALGGSMSLGVKLSYEPEAPVYVGVTTSNQDQGVVTSDPRLVFTSENYAVEQAVTLGGVDDGERAGDTLYQVILGLLSTDDPYYARFAFGSADLTVRHNVVSQDYPYARVRLGLWADSTTTREDDAATGAVANLTVGLCEAIYAPVELGGVAGTQAGELTVGSTTYGTSDDPCSGYWLDSDELFGTSADPRVSFVTAVVEVSDTSQGVLACADGAYGCSASYDGKSASLVFDRTGYPDVSSFGAPQLWVVGVDDFDVDDEDGQGGTSTAFEVSVVSASVKYFNERHEVGSGYLPDPLSFSNQDDDVSAFERNAWYTVSPAVGCSVFENPAAQMHDNCVLNVSFTDAMKRPLGGERFVFKIDVDVSQLGSSVYIDSVPSISQGLHWNSTCELGTEGCTTLSLSFLEGENTFNPKDVPFKKLYLLDNPDDPHIRFGNMSAQIALATVNDFWDDGDEAFQVVADGFVGYNCSNGTLFLGCGTYVDSGNLTYTVDGTEYDDDTAGLVFSQWSSNSSFLALRTGREDGTDTDEGNTDGVGGGSTLTSLRAIPLPQNTTSESGEQTVTFGVRLSSQPSDTVTVAVTTQQLSDEWGSGRVEGVPTRNGSLQDGGGYKVTRTQSAASWLSLSSRKDAVSNLDTGRLLLTFTPWNWNEEQNVTVVGLDDLAADGDVAYNLYCAVNGTEGELYRYAPSDGGFEEPARVPLVNADNEFQTPGWTVQQNGDVVGEPFYGYVASIDVYPATEPSDVILLSFSSTKPWIANTSETLVAISPSDWDQQKTVYVTAVDNFEDDGTIGFEVEMLMLGSSDQMYGALIQNTTFSFTKVDDPEDTTADAAVGMEFGIGENLYGVKQTFTTEYGGDGMLLDDVTKTGSVTLTAALTFKPQDDVTYAVTVSDTSEAQVLYPGVIVFTPDNWDQSQEVVVIGRSDSVADGDVEYDVEFNLLGTNDPYYRVLSPNATKYSLINQDTVDQRVALGISSLGCYNITEGTASSRGYQIEGDATCTVTASLCLSDTDGCTQKLSAQEVYNTTESLGVDSISVWAFVGDRRVAYLAQPPSAVAGQVNVTTNGTEAHVVLGVGRTLETAFNLTVYATDDTKDEPSSLATDITFYGVLRKGGVAIQEFVNYYDDFGDVTAMEVLTGSLEGTNGGVAVRTGSVPVVTRDDETARLVFYKATPGCNTGEYGRIETPDQDVSDGTCLLYLRLGSKPNLGALEEVEITIQSSNAAAGLFAMSYDADGTDTVDFTDPALPTTFVSSHTLSFTADDWDTPVKIVLVGQDDTEAEGDKLYEVSATVDSSPDANYAGLAVTLDVYNLEDDTAVLNVTQAGVPVGAREALGVDEAGWVAGACRAFTVVVHEDLWLSGLGDGGALSSTLTITSSDTTEGLVGTTCDPTPTSPAVSTYAESVTVTPDSVVPALGFVTKRGRGAVFYYIGVDDEDDDGDIEFSITVDVARPTYTTSGVTTEGESASYTFFLTNYDDDALVLSNPDVEGEREFKLTAEPSSDSGNRTLTLLEPESCPTNGAVGCADTCASTQADGADYEAISCSEPVSGSDTSVASNRTGKLSFSYPVTGTWNATDFTKARVTFDFSANVGRFQLNFGVKGGADTNCTDAGMQDFDAPTRSSSCWVDFDTAEQTLYMFVTALADEVDRGAFVESFVDVSTSMFYRDAEGSSATFASDEASLFDRAAYRPYDGSVAAKAARSQRFVISLVEDDLAGLAVNQTQTNSSWYSGQGGFQALAYRGGPRNGISQDDTSSVSTVTLPFATTKEAGGNVSFSVALTSEPLVGASVYVWAEQVARSDGSETRYEGIPWPSSYTWTRYRPSGDWAKQQVEDVVELQAWGVAHKVLTFTPADWAQPQDVLVVGLNDLYDDSSVTYNVYLTTVVAGSSGGDDDDAAAANDPWYALLDQVALPLTNKDDDEAGLGAYWDDYSTGPVYGTVSEPYYGLDATLYFYLKSKPTDTVLVTLVSSSPSQAQADVAVAAIGPSDWGEARFSTVSGVDDRTLDGTQNFTVTVSVVFSTDTDYGTSDANEDGVTGRMSLTMDGYALDDPTDVSATTCGLGEYGLFGIPTSNCTACPKGTYADEAGDKAACRLCPPGTFGAYSGSQALTAASDFDGTFVEPGCLPCPNGTYNDAFGATSCALCPEGKSCSSLATVTPLNAAPWERYATSFDKRWTQVSSTAFKATVPLGGEDKEMNRDQYEAYLVISGFGTWLLVGLLLCALYYCGPRDRRDRMIRFFRVIDLYPHSHEEVAKNEEYAETVDAPSALGGTVSLAVVLLGLLTTSVMFYTYVNYNTVATSTLDVFNTTFVDKVKVDVTAQVTFVGFSGCSNETYLPATVGESTAPGMVATGVTYESRTSSYECRNGNLVMVLALEGMKVATNPKLYFSVVPSCGGCAADASLNPRLAGNDVLVCPSCTVASAQAIKYQVEASNNYGESEGLHNKDDNFVNGSEVPDSSSAVFRGADATEVKVLLMPAEYENRRSWRKSKAYRLVYSETELGSTQGFEGEYAYAGTTTRWVGADANVSAPEDYESWVSDGSWAEDGAANEVHFTLDLPLASSRVTILVDNSETFLDLWAQLGGVLGLLVAVMLLCMRAVERSHDRQDMFGDAAAAGVKWYKRTTADWQDRRRPAPEIWRMDQIDAMPEKEERSIEMAPRKPQQQQSSAAAAAEAEEEEMFGGDEEDEDNVRPLSTVQSSSGSKLKQRTAAAQKGVTIGKATVAARPPLSALASASRSQRAEEEDDGNYDNEVDDFHGYL